MGSRGKNEEEKFHLRQQTLQQSVKPSNAPRPSEGCTRVERWRLDHRELSVAITAARSRKLAGDLPATTVAKAHGRTGNGSTERHKSMCKRAK